MKFITVIGCGNMGYAHLSSFLRLKRRFIIYLVDKNKNKLDEIKKKIEKNFPNTTSLITYSSKIPKKKIIDFAIIATHVYQRFLITKNLLKKNRILILFLEKFLFNKIKHYREIENLLKKNKTKTYVNVWSKLFLSNVKLKQIQNKELFFRIFVRKGRILTNLIHYYYLIQVLTNREIDINFTKAKLIKKNFSHLSFDEVSGKVIFKEKLKNLGEIQNSPNNNDILKISTKNKEFKLIMSGSNILRYENNKNRKKYQFPRSSITTANFFIKMLKKTKIKPTDFPDFKIISKISKKIMTEGKKVFKKNLNIR